MCPILSLRLFFLSFVQNFTSAGWDLGVAFLAYMHVNVVFIIYQQILGKQLCWLTFEAAFF